MLACIAQHKHADSAVRTSVTLYLDHVSSQVSPEIGLVSCSDAPCTCRSIGRSYSAVYSPIFSDDPATPLAMYAEPETYKQPILHMPSCAEQGRVY